MSTDNFDSSQAERFVDETLKKLKKSLRNTILGLWIVFTLIVIYLFVLNYVLVKSTNEVLGLAEVNATGEAKWWEDAKGYIEKTPDLRKDEKYSKHIAKAEEAIKWAATGNGKDSIEEYRGYLKNVNDPKFYDNVSKQIDKSKNMVKDITEFDVHKYTNQIEQAQMMLDLINEANETEKLAEKIGQVVARELETQGNVVAQYASELLDENLDTLPEWAKAQVPKYSNRLQDKVELWINQFCVATSDDLGGTFDTFLDDHADKIKEFSEASDDEIALRQLDDELTIMVSTFMKTTPIENYGTLDEQSQNFLSRIQAANNLLKPLVENKKEDLTPEQQLLRRTLAIFMNKIDTVNLEQKN